ncbi:hypothetical protein RIF29_29932 [Crotalaria pallida]|uniref:Uncharacterized protein n=1 Tax=Crotalaria pallida TaxID=3830 RepID=A0AAN9I0V0_CROPI
MTTISSIIPRIYALTIYPHKKIKKKGLIQIPQHILFSLSSLLLPLPPREREKKKTNKKKKEKRKMVLHHRDSERMREKRSNTLKLKP